jgi:hypothetical protein
MTRLLKPFLDHWKAISLTFEIFWIVIFVLEAAATSSPPEVRQFIYANF